MSKVEVEGKLSDDITRNIDGLLKCSAEINNQSDFG